MQIQLQTPPQAVRGELSQFVDDLVVTEQLVQTILETPVSEQTFLEQLQVMRLSLILLVWLMFIS